MTASLITASPWQTSFWNWRGFNIRYAVMGQGRPLLLIHGFGAAIEHWRQNIPTLASGGYRVFALDLLGFGHSDKPALDYTLELWQALLKDFWTAQIQEPTVFVGNSIGALLSLMVLANHPEIAAGAVLLNAAGGLNHRPDELNLPLRVVMNCFTQLVSSPIVGPFLFDRIRQKNRIRETLYQVYCNRAAVTEELVHFIYGPACDPGAQKVFASILSAPPGPKPEELLSRIDHPLLVLWGEADPWTPIAGSQIYQQWGNPEAAKPSIEFVPIPQAGHCPHDERPEVVNPLMLEWLAQLN